MMSQGAVWGRPVPGTACPDTARATGRVPHRHRGILLHRHR